MAIGDRPGSVPGTTYNGFSGPPIKASGAEKRRRTILLAGVLGALAVGLLAGVVARPELALGDQAEMAPVRQTPTGPQLAIEVDPAPPPPAAGPVVRAERLEVLPAALARAAPKPPPVVAVEATYREDYREEPYREEEVSREDAGRMPDEPPIDCSAPADRHEARICRDIGFLDERPARFDPPRRWYEEPGFR